MIRPKSDQFVYSYKPKAERLLLPILFFLAGSFIVAYTAHSAAPGFSSAFLWLISVILFAYAAIPIWFLIRNQRLTITETAIRVPQSTLISRTREIPFVAISYMRLDHRACTLVVSAPSRRVFIIKRSLLPNQQAFDEIRRILRERVPESGGRIV